MQKKPIITLSLLLAAFAGTAYPESATINAPIDRLPCPVGSSCQNLGGDVFAEEERLNQGLKADSDKRMETDASKIRNQNPEDMEKTIEKLERQR